MRRILAFLFLLCSLPADAQNLVQNPGLEMMGGAGRSGDLQAASWYMPTTATTDYLLSDFADLSYRMSNAHSGKAYAGLVAYTSLGGMEHYREYLGGQLSQPLEAGKNYTITLYIGVGDGCRYLVPELQLYFSKERLPFKDSESALDVTPQVTIEGTGDKALINHWTLFTVSYTATGGERFFVIGNFLGTDDTEPVTREKAKQPYAYYCFDDMSVVPEAEETDSSLIAEKDSIIVHTPVRELPQDTETIAPGKKLVAQNIYFETGRSTLLPESYDPLYQVIIAMKMQPNLKVEIDGHTDAAGTPAANQQLSEDRAKAVAAFFIAHGIDASRITTKGYGSSQPISDDYRMNRRVEFLFSE